MDKRQRPAPNKRAPAAAIAHPSTDGESRSLWFDPPIDDQDRRPRLTRERVVAEALTVIANDGVQALTMRSLAARLGVVPGAVYHHVRNKEQLQDLVLDGVLAEVEFDLDSSLRGPSSSRSWPIGCAGCSRPIPGWPGSSRPATPSGLIPWPWPRRSCRRCWRPGSVTATPGWPSSCWSTTPSASPSAAPRPLSTSNASATPPSETQLHQFFRSLPPDRFPALVAVGEHVWVDNRDERFTAGLDVLIAGLEYARNSPTAEEGRA